MADIGLNGSTPKHIKRIKPQFSVDINGNITWIPSLVDYDASLFYRGKTVTNDEFNTLFLRDIYQGNYITDSLTELFEKHLGTAIYRSFTSDFNLVPSYVKTFDASNWGTIQEDGYYYITITAEEHGFKPTEDGTVLDNMNIDTEMYLLGSDGRFYEVTQIDTDADNTVRIYTDDNTLSGFIVVRTNDKAYALASQVVEASQVRGLADVATSAKYTDLVDIDAADGPNTKLRSLANDILSIVEGDTVVGEATHADKAEEAVRLPTNGYIQNIKVSDIFETGSRYVKDATRAKDYDTTTGSIKTKFDSIARALSASEEAINQVKNDVEMEYYKKTDTVENSLHLANYALSDSALDIKNDVAAIPTIPALNKFLKEYFMSTETANLTVTVPPQGNTLSNAVAVRQGNLVQVSFKITGSSSGYKEYGAGEAVFELQLPAGYYNTAKTLTVVPNTSSYEITNNWNVFMRVTSAGKLQLYLGSADALMWSDIRGAYQLLYLI